MSEEEHLNKIKKLEYDNKILLEQLKKYTNPQKLYYAKNKEVVNEKAKERLKKIAEENPDKIREYARNAYLKQKEKKLSKKVNII